MHRIHASLLLAAALTAPLAAEDVLIVNPASKVATVSADQLKDLFLGKKTAWDDGGTVVLCVLKEGARHTVLLDKIGKTQAQFLQHWKKKVFTGAGAMPETFDDEAALAAYVAKTAGAIGLVDKASAGGAKALAVP